MVEQIPKYKKNLSSLISFCILLSYVSLNPRLTYAENAEATTDIVQEPANITESKPNSSNTNNNIEEALTTEAVWFGYNEEVTIATRHETPVSKAPSIVTVITAEEIKNLGYRTFTEILRIIPGFELLKTGDFGTLVPAVRGITGSEKIRVMVNGHLVNSPFTGGAFTLFDDFPVESIKRIEVIRGPGSAMYGEDAFTAVINIITKDAKDIDGMRVSSGYGSFDTYDENIVFGKTFGNIGISGSVRYRQTEGFNGIVESDRQTEIDNSLSPFGIPPASQAPSGVHDGRQEYDMNLKTTYKDLSFEGLYINKNKGPFIGPQYALNDESDIETNYVFVEAGYKKTFEERFTLKPRIYYDQFDNNWYLESLPEGTTSGINYFDLNGDGIPETPVPVIHPDGVIGNGKVIERIVGTEIPFDYELFDGNIFTVGFEYRLINQSDVHFSSNFHPATMEPLDSVQDFSDTYPFIKETTRRYWSVYLQDIWDITNTLNLTLGVRHDQYNDFGNATSPRAGLTWAFTKDASLKVLYGEAFRAPSFTEMYTTNQPAVFGNPDLEPETIRTYEVGLSYRCNKHVTSSVNYFINDISDLITLRPTDETQSAFRYENFGDARVQGIEMETKVDITNGNYVFMNYTFQNPEDDNGNNLPFVSKHKGNFGVNAHCWKYVNTNLSAFFSGRRYRAEDDLRDDLPSYALLNLSVIGKEFYKTMEIQGTVFNLLDKDYRDPGPTSIQNDLPRPERTFFIGLRYQF